MILLEIHRVFKCGTAYHRVGVVFGRSAAVDVRSGVRIGLTAAERAHCRLLCSGAAMNGFRF